MITVIYGPRGCGKTRNGAALAVKYNCGFVIDVDDFIKRSRDQRLSMFNAGVLLLTTDEADARGRFPAATFIPFSATGMQ